VQQDLKPKWRNGVGMMLILLLIAAWAVLVATLAPYAARLPFLVEMLFYVVAGIAWILPVRPLLRWTATGTLRRR
jgi:hypothetical protein